MTSLRCANRPSLQGLPDQLGPAWVLRVDPSDGALFVLRDTPVLLRLSEPAEPASVSALTVWVGDALGPVPARISLSEDGRVVIWEARRLLVAGVEHVVVTRGLRDSHGRAIPDHRSRFVPCGLSREDLSG